MAKNLVIVESPTKAKTIGKYLGSDYDVRASMGHVRDLPKSTKDGIGVKVNGDVHLEYVVTTKARKFISDLKKAAVDAPAVFLATDHDREGEAIAWHIAEAAKIPAAKAHRVTFTEITQSAIREAFQNPRAVDANLVNAQQARRAVDRIVGYKLSPVLWRKIGGRTSAGRVQSAALRLVVDREREIQAFVPTEYWTIEAALATAEGAAFGARHPYLEKEKFSLPNGDAAAAVVEAVRPATWTVETVKRTERRRNPSPPFITSTLQQEASRKLGFSAKRAMAVAQQLYEGVELGTEGSVGLITYMRTDSPHVADQALAEIQQVVLDRFGREYALDKPRRFKAKASRAQEAHEAIRPTEAHRDPESLARFLDKDQLRLYTLIWQRAIASQMAQAVFDAVSVDIRAGGGLGAHEASGASVIPQPDRGHTFRASGQTVRFDGFMRVYTEGRDDPTGEEDAEGTLPDLTEGQVLTLNGVEPVQHFTEPPPRYTEASLVKSLEELGIGRPSTYAQIMSTLHDRKYVQSERKRLQPTDLGFVICDFLSDVYPKVVDLEFTAEMENELDKIAEGDESWEPMVRVFFGEVHEVSERAVEKAERPSEATDIDCPECGATTGAKMQKKWGRYGWFLSCERYPDCTARMKVAKDGGSEEVAPRPEPELTDVPCPQCGKPMLKRTGRFGEFLGCQDYPKCKGVKNLDDVGWPEIVCPKCSQGKVVRKRTKRRKTFFGCDRYPECDYAIWEPILAAACPECKGPLAAEGEDRARCLSCERHFDRSALQIAEPQNA
ncbi:MAG: type I DNA topoisomerase [Actinomycetota bacterium]